MAKTLFEVLEDKIDALIEPAKNAAITGAAEDFAAYRDLCGFIRGLNSAKMEIKDLADNYGEKEDE